MPGNEGTPEEDGGTHLTSVAQVLIHLDALKADIIKEVQASTDALREEAEALRRDVIHKLASMSTDVERAVLSASKVVGSRSQGGSKSRGSDSLKRRVPQADEVQDLPLIADREIAILSLMRCTMMFTVYSFVHNFPSAEIWLSEKMQDNMSEVVHLLFNVSGFSFLFFSVASDDSKARYRSRIGALWSRLCTSAIVLMVLTARSKHYGMSTARVIPAWLSSLGGLKKASGIVSEVLECLERTNQLLLVRASKKQRREDDSISVAEDPHRGEHEQAIRSMRSVLLRAMSTGRTEARVHIYKSFLFLVEKIRNFPTIDDAKANGYEIVMKPAASGDELTVPAQIPGSIWDIAKSAVANDADGTVDSKNSEAFQTLVQRFPSLSVQLRYKRRVIRSAEIVPEDVCDIDGDIYWEVTETLSLHKVAVGLLVEMYKAKSYLNILGSSSSALRAVHIFVVALRGVIRKSMEMSLSVVERSALGDVTFRVLEKNEYLATVMLGMRSDRSKDGNESATRDRERALKLEMSWTAYEAARKKKRDKERRGAEESSISSARQPVAAEQDEDDDFDVEWVN